MNKLTSDIVKLVKAFRQNIEQYLPALELEINRVIEEKNVDIREIEKLLDTLLSLTHHGIGDNLYIKLLEYYKDIDSEGAKFYWEEYDDSED